MTTTYHPAGDRILSVDVRVKDYPRSIAYADILDAVEVRTDEYDAPWKVYDGFDHKKITSPNYHERAEQGYKLCFPRGGRRCLIEIDYDEDLYNYYRQNGAAKGVADYLTRKSMRQRTGQLVNWYSNGWEWYYVTGDYLDAGDSIGGIDDYNYADKEVRRDVADEIAAQLEARGHTIIGRPAPVNERVSCHRSRVNMFNA